MKLKDITPTHLKCLVGACPAVYQTDDGRCFVVGKRASAAASGAVPFDKIGPDEVMIEVPEDLLLRLSSTSEK